MEAKPEQTQRLTWYRRISATVGAFALLGAIGLSLESSPIHVQKWVIYTLLIVSGMAIGEGFSAVRPDR
jgi:NADH:ubiquinone oxidoreductase subunit 6 (subunit J)